MKLIIKNIGWLLISIIIGLLLISHSFNIHSSPPRFFIESDGRIEEFTIFEGEDNKDYVFLPSYAKMEQLQVTFEKNESIMIDDIVLSNGMNCGQFACDTDYILKNTNGKTSTIRFCKSENVAAIYINTISGSMRYVDGDKNHKEQISLKIVHPDGSLEYYDDSATIGGRGNSSWGAEKKSYGLKISAEADIFSMGNALNWVLLANASDITHLRNKLTFDIAKNTGMNWVPETQFVDLYFNGEYNGLYLFAEKVEIGASRLNIDPEKGDFLCKIEIGSRLHTLNSPIITNSGRTVEVVAPQHSLYSTQAEIEQKVNDLESLLQSGDNLNKNPTFDLDSWVHRYLIDEISGNADSDLASSYFYSYNGTIYAGPVWDYDYSFRNPQQGHHFIANQSAISNSFGRPYYSTLYANQSFYNRVVEIYETDFLPVLNEMINHRIVDYATQIDAAAKMNAFRWSIHSDTFNSAEILTRFLIDRMHFLNEVWLVGKVVHCVQVEEVSDQLYLSFSVEDGELFETDLIDLGNTMWIVKETGEQFDPTKPICKDTILVRQTPVHMSSVEDTRMVITLLTILFCTFCIFVFILVDIRYCSRQKGGIFNKWTVKR